LGAVCKGLKDGKKKSQHCGREVDDTIPVQLNFDKEKIALLSVGILSIAYLPILL